MRSHHKCDVCRVIECKGPTNTRVYTVAVYFRGERLASGSGHSIQQAEMAAASRALSSTK
ncbi:DROSHA, partial [Cordylochernes scorpioides]